MTDDVAYKTGFRAGTAAAAGIAQRLANEIKGDLKKTPRGFRSAARMRAMAEMFAGLAELIESDDPNAVENALKDLRKGFGYVAKKDAVADFGALLGFAGVLARELGGRSEPKIEADAGAKIVPMRKKAKK